MNPRQIAGATRRRRSLDQVIAAARTQFTEHGWDEVTLETVAEESDISTRTISFYFASKRNLVLATFVGDLERVLKFAKMETEPRQAVVVFVTALCDTAWALPALATALLPVSRDARRSVSDSRPPAPEIGIVDFSRLAEAFAELLNRYWMGGHGHPDATIHAAEMYLSGVLTWMLLHQDRGRNEAADYLLRHIL